MKNNRKFRPWILILAVALMAGLAISAWAVTVLGDVNGDGEITAFDAQMVAEATAGKRELTAEQKLHAGALTVKQIINHILGIEQIPDEPETPAVQVGDAFKSSQLAPVTANGENGMTLYYTSNGTDLTAFAGFDPNNHNGRWYYYVENAGVLAFVDPFVNPADNYGWIGSSGAAYVVIGYEMPATGTVTLTNWLARHTAFDTQILISQGTVGNVVGGFDVVAGHEGGMINNMSLNVTEGETVYISYKTINGPATADTCYLGFQTSYTYTAVGAVEEEEIVVNKGDVFRFADLSTTVNGEKGLTFYYGANATDRTAFSTYDPNNNNGRWYYYDGSAVQAFVDPFANAADNFGLVGTSATQMVTMGYKLPATGTINLYTWGYNYVGAGYTVKVALGSTNNVVGTYQIGVTAPDACANYAMDVTAGQMLYLIYQPVGPANGDYCGYINQITYTKVPVVVNAGDTFEVAQLATAGVNGDNGMTLYHCDGTNLTAYDAYDPNNNGGRWYHVANGAVETFIDPTANVADNYGLVGSSANEYVVVGLEMPASGQIQLDTWIALHTASPYRVLISKGAPENVVAGRDVSGVTDTISYEHDVINVDAGEMIYVSYKPLAEGATSGSSYAGYKIGYTYLSVGQVDDEQPVSVGTVFKSAELAGTNNGDNGFTMYYTADGAGLTPYSLYDEAAGNWYEVTNDAVSLVNPKANPADNYGVGQTTPSSYVVLAYKIPATGTVDAFTWTANQNGAGYQVSLALGSLNNVVQTYTATELGVPAYNTYSLNVVAGQTVYLIYKPMSAAAGDWFGYINQITYTSVG